MTVIAFVGVFSRADNCSFQRCADEQTFASAISINRGPWSHIRFRCPADRSRGDARIRTEGYISSFRKRVHRAVAVQHDHEICNLRADLRAPSSTAGADERRTRPSTAGSGDDNAFTAFSAKNKPSLYHANNREAAGMAKNPRRNSSLRHVPEFTNGLG